MIHYEFSGQMFHGRKRALQSGTDPDQAVNRQANDKIQGHAQVNPVILMTQREGKMMKK